MKKIDARGLGCPKPVILTKNEMANEKEILVLVDNDVARQNIERLANSMKYSVEVEKKENDFEIHLSKMNDVSSPEIIKSDSWVLLISGETLGKGSDELGKILMKGYLYTLTETKPYPETILIMNEGVNLVTINEDAVNNLMQLENEGVEIIVCGTCLDYYGKKDLLKVGIIGNMYSIVEKMNNAKKVIQI